MKTRSLRNHTIVCLLLFCTVLISMLCFGFLGVDTAYAFTEQECRTCHTGSPEGRTVDMHHSIPDKECLDCHTEGGPGGFIVVRDCTVCHGDDHHSGPTARQGKCDNCHTDPRDPSKQPNGYLTKQFGCDICHIKIEPMDEANSTLTVMAYDPIQPTGRPDGITKQAVTTANGFASDHVFTIDPGATVRNYGACFHCHGTEGVDAGHAATLVYPYHGHYAVNWQPDKYLDPLDDRPGIPPKMQIPDGYSVPFGSNAQWAPGRGIFNVFETVRRWPNHFYNNNNSNPNDNVSRGNQYNQDTEGFFGQPAIEFSFAPVNFDNDSLQQFWVPSFDVVRGMTVPSDYIEITRVDHTASDSGGGRDGNGAFAFLEVEGNCSPRSNLTVVVYGGEPYSIGSCSRSGTFAATVNLPFEDGYTEKNPDPTIPAPAYSVWRTYFEEGTVWVISEGQGYDWYYNGTESRWDGCWADGHRWDTSTLTYTYDPATCPVDYVAPDGGDGGGSNGGGGGGDGGHEPSTDSVTITRSEYSSRDDRLTVYATSTMGRDVQMNVMYDGREYSMNWDSRDDRFEVNISARSCNDSTIEVGSSAGGIASSSVQNCSRQ